jgi:hypothetical protein
MLILHNVHTYDMIGLLNVVGYGAVVGHVCVHACVTVSK